MLLPVSDITVKKEPNNYTHVHVHKRASPFLPICAHAHKDVHVYKKVHIPVTREFTTAYTDTWTCSCLPNHLHTHTPRKTYLNTHAEIAGIFIGVSCGRTV